MAYDYTQLSAIATSLLSKFGRTMYIRSYTEAGTSYKPVRSETDTAITGVQSRYKISEIDGGAVQKDDKKIIIDSTVEPTTRDKLYDDDTLYGIVDVQKIQPGDTVLAYIIQARA